MSTCTWYSSCEISSAVRSGVSCSAAIQTSAASSTTFLPMVWTPASRAATVPEPAGRVAALPLSAAKRWWRVFTPDRLGDRLDGRVRQAPQRLLARHAQPHEEAPDDEGAVDAVHHGRRVELEVQELRHADEVDGDPAQPELDPAAGHRVRGEHRTDEDPPVGEVVPPRHREAGTRRPEHEVPDHDGDQDGPTVRETLARDAPERHARRAV